MDPLRILHVTPYWSDAWAYGGIPRVAGAQTRGLASRGHDVVVCATDACSETTRLQAPSDAAQGTPWRRAVQPGLELRVFANRSNRMAFHLQVYTPTGLTSYLRDHAASFDVAHLHACRNWPVAVAARELARHGVPFVLGPNGTAPVIERRQWAKRIFDVVLGRRILSQAAAVLAVSEVERRQLVDLGVPAERVHLVPNPVDLDEFTTPIERGRFRSSAGLGARPVIAFLGKITPRKRVDLLVRAFAEQDQSAHLVLAGSDMGGLQQALALAAALGVRDRVHVEGVLAGRRRIELLADADVVVYPSEHEIFGLVPLEALLSGTPVVVADDSGCGEVIGKTGGGLVVAAGDSTALMTAIRHVLAAPGAWRDAARAAGAVVRSEYDASRVVTLLEQVYAHVRPATLPSRAGVSFVVPVRNGGQTLAAAIAGIEGQQDGRPFEILVVDDGSEDGSAAWLAEAQRCGRLRVIDGPRRGVAAALNAGVLAARHPIICQVDQDVELGTGWLALLTRELDRDPTLGAVEGHYALDRGAGALPRVMALDLEQRYVTAVGREVTHVCTGNTAYRASALATVGPFDERFGYGADNDMSYRLRRAGYRLAHCARARSVHHWRATVAGFCRQQYGFGYGRLDVVARHPGQVAGDSVAPALMMAHPLVLLVALASGVWAFAAWTLGQNVVVPVTLSTGLVAALAGERAVAGARAAWRFRDRAALLFPLAHLLRDLCWIAAVVVWCVRRVAGRTPRPAHSMAARPSIPPIPFPAVPPSVHWRVAAVIPVHNEARSIAAVVADLGRQCPTLEVVIVDDGSTDGTEQVLQFEGVRYLRLFERMGVGSAVRAGLRYARRQGFDAVIRLDGDGQHAAADIAHLLVPLVRGEADVVLGSRYMTNVEPRSIRFRAVQAVLAGCLTALTRRAVTDPTSGFCALGPRALELLSEHHPTGYAEAELRLLLARNGLSVAEVSVGSHARRAGRTSLTASRLVAAGARVLLALLIVPLRRVVTGADAD